MNSSLRSPYELADFVPFNYRYYIDFTMDYRGFAPFRSQPGVHDD